MTKKNAEQLFEKLAAVIDPKGELNYETLLDLLIAVVLSAQTTDKAVNKVTARLWQKCRTVDDYLAFGEENLREECRTIGLYRNKSKSVIGLCQKLKDDFNSEVPHTREALESLPGVGRKTANVVMNIGLGMPFIAVDTHVFRVANRTGLVIATTPLQVEEKLLKIVPKRFLVNAHHYLLLHGRYCCKARKPECDRCPIAELCQKVGVK